MTQTIDEKERNYRRISERIERAKDHGIRTIHSAAQGKYRSGSTARREGTCGYRNRENTQPQ